MNDKYYGPKSDNSVPWRYRSADTKRIAGVTTVAL